MATQPEAHVSLPEVAPQPVLGLPDPIIRVGKVRHNQSRTVTMPVANTGAGGKDLQVALRCDLPWATLSETDVAIPPGETHPVQVQLSPPDAVKGGDFVGRVTIQARNAVFEQSGVVELRGRVIEDVALVADPSAIVVEEAKTRNEPVSVSLSVTRNDKRPAQPYVQRVEAEDGLAQSFDLEVAPTGAVRVAIHTANREPKSHHGVLVIADRDPDVREVHVPVSVGVSDVARLRCESEYTLEAPDIRGSAPIELENAGGETLHVKVSSTAAWLTPSPTALELPPPDAEAGLAARLFGGKKAGSRQPLTLSYDLSETNAPTRLAVLELLSNDNGCPQSVRHVWIVVKRLYPKLDPPEYQVPRPFRPGRPGPFSIKFVNRGPGVAYVTFPNVPSWVSLQQVEVRIPPGGTRTVRGTATPAPGSRSGSVNLTLPIKYNAAPGEKEVL